VFCFCLHALVWLFPSSCYNGYAAEAKRKKAAEETEFSGSWALRKIMRDKALNGGGMSMQDVVSMERMYAPFKAFVSRCNPNPHSV
jgi:hypothetical protein